MAVNPNSPYSLLDSYYQYQMNPPAQAAPSLPSPTPTSPGVPTPPLPDFFSRPGPSVVIQAPDQKQQPQNQGAPPTSPTVPTPPPLPPDAQNRLLQAMSLQGLLSQFMGGGGLQRPDSLGLLGNVQGLAPQFSSLVEPGIRELFNRANVRKRSGWQMMNNPEWFPQGMSGPSVVMDPQVLQIAASLINQIIQSGGGMGNA